MYIRISNKWILNNDAVVWTPLLTVGVTQLKNLTLAAPISAPSAPSTFAFAVSLNEQLPNVSISSTVPVPNSGWPNTEVRL